MSKFIDSMNSYTTTENGALAYKSTNDYGLDLFFQGVRNISNETIEEKMVAAIRAIAKPDDIVNLIILTFLTRDTRGTGCGKGEKHLFDRMFLILFRYYPITCIKLLNYIPQYGSFKDLIRIAASLSLEGTKDSVNVETLVKVVHPRFKRRKLAVNSVGKAAIQKQMNHETQNASDRLKEMLTHLTVESIQTLKDAILRVYVDQLQKDSIALIANQSISFAAKYAPRAGASYGEGNNVWIRQGLKNLLFPNDQKSSEKYRKFLVRLTSALNCPEIKMSKKEYSQIDIKHIPSQCLKRHRLAFLNVDKSKPMLNELTGNRYPDDEDRIECRKNMLSSITKKDGKIHGKAAMPHEIVEIICNATDESEISLLNAQWDDIRINVLKNMEKLPMSDFSTGSINLGRIVPMCDVSGSMAGTPMTVAIALSILVSEINHPNFQNHVLTFSQSPTWINLADCLNLNSKVKKLKRADWGMNTDIIKAFKLILSVVKKNNLNPEDVPDLLILSDMQFDSASNSNTSTTFELIKNMFHKYGMETMNQPFPIPRIIFWNLRGDTKSVPETSNANNVQMLAGFSPSMLKCVLSSDDLNAFTPLSTFLKALADPAYDSLRNALKSPDFNEGFLAEYV